MLSSTMANVIAIAFLTIAYVFLFFPAVPDPNAAGMNWACLVYGVVVLFAVGYYIVHGRVRVDGHVSREEIANTMTARVRWAGGVCTQGCVVDGDV